MAMLNLKAGDLKRFQLLLGGPIKCDDDVQELLDRGWAHREDDGTIVLTTDGIEVAKMVGIVHDGGATAEDGAVNSAATT